MATSASTVFEALRDRYTLERELGRGGMATVYLACDLKHQRLVALKVLHAELAHAVGPERFLREIQTAARLQHPHILGLIDSGTLELGPGVQGPYYLMPYVEGESLRDRLNREGQLPLQEALKIACDVTAALTYAHSHGVVHRDIKPENILLAGREPSGSVQAVVADFGIAWALEAAGGDKLTQTGLALGTPAYMSPEQAAGDNRLDGRADIYSLGCVLYEMLGGEPPFTGPSAKAILARHAIDPVPRLRTIRQTVPEGVEQAITRAMAKVPADRFANAEEFAAALNPPSTAAAPTTRAAWPHRWLVRSAAAIVLVAAGTVTWLRLHSRAGPVPPSSSLIAVLPFRVSGADPALHYLHEGMVDLLAVKLTGEGGPRAADPRAVLSAWQHTVSSSSQDVPPDVALALARRLGAGLLIDGSVVGTPNHLTLTASVLQVPSGRSSALANVYGPADSLPGLIDQLTGQLLAQEAAEPEQRLASLSTTSLPALRVYLDGRAANRRGRYPEAVDHFTRALELDSSFALAALGVITAAGWFGVDRSTGSLELAWANRNRLSARDRAILTAYAGPRYPKPSTYREFLGARERAATLAGDQPEVWYELGDILFHGGPLLGLTDYRSRAADAFRRAVELDSAFAGPLGHMVELAAISGDTSAVRGYGALYLAADSASEYADFIRWRIAVALGDTVSLRQMMNRSQRTWTLHRILSTMVVDGIALDQLGWVTAALARHDSADGWLQGLALNRGRPKEALAIAQRDPEAQPPTHWYLRSLIEDALYGEGDSTAAAQAVRQLSPAVDRPLPRGAVDMDQRAADICSVTIWRIAHGDLGTAARAVDQLRRIDRAGCATLLEAMLATSQHRPNAKTAVDRADPQLSPTPLAFGPCRECLLIARMRESLGDLGGALAVIRRRAYAVGGAHFLSSFLREEGRLAALTGDTAGAIKAYRHYLALRSEAEPALKPEVQRVRGELAGLLTEPRP